jgi:hypothetical protein
MKPSNNRCLVFVGAATIASLIVSGCQSGDVSKRDDGKQAALAGALRDSGLYDTQVREAAARLMKDHPGLSPKEAYAQARSSVTPSHELVGPTRTERERAAAQEKFEDDLAKLDK